MNTILSKDLAKKKLTYKSQSYTQSGSTTVGVSISGDFTLKTSQPIYIEHIVVGYRGNCTAIPFSIINDRMLLNPVGTDFRIITRDFCFHSQNNIPKPNDIQIVAGATEFNASANESKLLLPPGIINPIDRIVVGNFGVSFAVHIADTTGSHSSDVLSFDFRVTIHYAIID